MDLLKMILANLTTPEALAALKTAARYVLVAVVTALATYYGCPNKVVIEKPVYLPAAGQCDCCKDCPAKTKGG